MTKHPGAERLNDLVDGLLPPEEETAVRAHLASCPTCAATAGELEEVVGSLGRLPTAATPPAHLWAGIRGRMEERRDPSGGEADVLSFPGRASAPRRISLTLPQLASAAAVVALLAAGLARVVVPGPEPAATAASEVAVIPSSAPGGGAARAVSVGPEGYDQVIRELELLVAGGREVLAPETLATLEESLATVDAALSDVRRALAEDPGSDFLRRMLAGHQTTKVRVLRQALTAIETRS